MNRDHLMKTLVAANVVFAFASVGAEAFFGWTLPTALADFTRARFTSLASSGAGAVAFALIVASALCAIVAWVGLLGYRRSARRLLVVSLGLSVLHTLFAGPSVSTSVSAMFGVMDAVVGGVLLGLVYFSDLAPRFEDRVSANSPATAELAGGRRA